MEGRPLSGHWWWEEGACVGAPDPDSFFEIEDALTEDRPARVRKIRDALDYCARCPIREECARRGAGEKGIWGGLTAIEREAQKEAG